MLPLTPATEGLLDARRLALLPRGAALVNVARGAVVDESALIAALRSGQVGEATLDVFATEPLPEGHAFWGMDQVLVTPHLASTALPASAAAERLRRTWRAFGQGRGFCIGGFGAGVLGVVCWVGGPLWLHPHPALSRKRERGKARTLTPALSQRERGTKGDYS